MNKAYVLAARQAAALVGCLAGTAWGGMALTNEAAVLSFDAQGRVASLRLRTDGRELVRAKKSPAFVSVREASGRVRDAQRAESAGAGRLTFRIAGGGTVNLRFDSFGLGWTVTLESTTVTNAAEIVFARVSPVCTQRFGRFVNGFSDDRSAVVLRAYTLLPEMRIDMRAGVGTLEASATPLSGFSNVRAGITAVPRAAVLPALDRMTDLSGAPRSPTGGVRSLAAEENRESYLFANASHENLEDWMDLAERGGFTTLHLYGWYANNGEYAVARRFKGEKTELKRLVDRIRARGLKASMHTLTGCLSYWSPLVPENVRELDKVRSFALAEPLSAEATEIVVDDPLDDRYDTVVSYGSNGNFLRIGDEIIQYGEVKKGYPGAFRKCRRGALKTTKGVHAKGEACDFLRQSLESLYPNPMTPLADRIANRMAEICNDCGMSGIFFDGSEAMRTRYGVAAMRWKTVAALDPKRPVFNEASVERQHNWWYHSRIRYEDHAKFAAKAWVDDHVHSALTGRDSDFLAPQTGWWAPRRPSPVARGFFLDETEYFASRNAGNDLASSMQNIDMVESGVSQNAKTDGREPIALAVERQMTVAGWYERVRLARAFAPAAAAYLAPDGAEARLRQQAASGRWEVTPVTSAVHRTAGAALPDRWILALPAPRRAAVRIEALYAAGDYDDPTAIPLTPGDVRFDSSSPALKESHRWRPCRELPLEYGDGTKDLSERRAIGLTVTGDGSGAWLDVSLVPDRIHGYRWADHHLVKLDFRGPRYFSFLLREKDIAGLLDKYWAEPFNRNVFMCELDAKHVNGVVLNLAGIPKGGKTDIRISQVRALPVRRATLTDLTLAVNGTTYAVPFPLESGEWAEYDEGAWIRYSEQGVPLKRVVAPGPDCLAAGGNAFAFAAHCATAGVRAETTVFALDRPIAALAETRNGRQRQILAYEAAMPAVWAPARGFGELPPLTVRPGERAACEIEIIGPVAHPCLRLGGWRGDAPVVVARGQRLRCRDGRTWTVTDMDRKIVAKGTFAEPLPLFSECAPAGMTSSDPDAAFARLNLIKRYVK